MSTLPKYVGLVEELDVEDLLETLLAWAIAHSELKNKAILTPTEIVNEMEADPSIRLSEFQEGHFPSYGEAIGFIVGLIKTNINVQYWRIRFMKAKLSRITLGRYPSGKFMLFPEIYLDLPTHSKLITTMTQRLEAVSV